MNIHTIAVIGGTGKSGTYLVKALLHKGYRIKMLVRNPERVTFQNPLAEIITGNVADYQSVLQTITGSNAVISTLGLGIPPSEHTIFSTANDNILNAMSQADVNRYIVIAGLNVDAPGDAKGPAAKAATEWMYANYPTSTHDRQLEYNLLSHSDADWTMVRLPMIELTDAQPEINVSLTDCPGTAISAASLAEFLIRQIEDDDFIRKAPFIANK
jgi:putative NADH-flavin reductase